MLGTIVYWSLMKIYNLLIIVASVFNPKAKLWLKGRKKIFRLIENQLKNDKSSRVWFHCASLGEFEQARPVIEEFRKNFPSYKIILTFFSPSGYEAKKDCKLVDWVFYLPLDTPANARKLVGLLKPNLVFFSKYDFWFFILRELHRKQIPVLLFSAVFRDNQLFFKKVGGWYRRLLFYFSHIFVQDLHSKELLEKYGITNVTVTGDTRFDRVYQIARQPVDLPCIESFAQGHKVIVAGSTYLQDALIISDFIVNQPDIRLIIAPHEIDQQSLEDTMSVFYSNYYRYSILKEKKLQNFEKQVLIIDTIGLLSKIYRYGTIAYVGGGFGSGIHNILEAVVYGKPVIFGPNYRKFNEAIDLINLQVAYSVQSSEEFFEIAERLMNDEQLLDEISKRAKNYILQNTGSSQKIISWIKENLQI